MFATKLSGVSSFFFQILRRYFFPFSIVSSLSPIFSASPFAAASSAHRAPVMLIGVGSRFVTMTSNLNLSSTNPVHRISRENSNAFLTVPVTVRTNCAFSGSFVLTVKLFSNKPGNSFLPSILILTLPSCPGGMTLS